VRRVFRAHAGRTERSVWEGPVFFNQNRSVSFSLKLCQQTHYTRSGWTAKRPSNKILARCNCDWTGVEFLRRWWVTQRANENVSLRISVGTRTDDKIEQNNFSLKIPHFFFTSLLLTDLSPFRPRCCTTYVLCVCTSFLKWIRITFLVRFVVTVRDITFVCLKVYSRATILYIIAAWKELWLEKSFKWNLIFSKNNFL